MRELVSQQRKAPIVLVTSANPYKLRAMLQREHERRALLVRVPMAEVEPGLWGAWIVQLKPYRPAWVRPAQVIAGSVAGAGAVVAGVWWLVGVVSVLLAGVSVAVVLVLLALAGILYGSSGNGCETTVTVRHRHR